MLSGFSIAACTGGDARDSSTTDVGDGGSLDSGTGNGMTSDDSTASESDNHDEAGTSADTGSTSDSGGGCVGCAPCDEDIEPTAFEQTLLDLPPQTWFRAPNSHMREVCPPDTADYEYSFYCKNAVAAWSSGAYDSTRRRMMIWGGGHEDYRGNELYGFDLTTGVWSRVTEPSIPREGAPCEPGNCFYSQDPLPDGQPVSRHSYDGVEFLPDLDRLWGHGGSRSRDGNGTNVNWFFDAESGWYQKTPGFGGFSLATAYDQGSRQIMVYTSEYLNVYDVDADTWTSVPGFGFANTGLWPRYSFAGDKTAVVDPSRGLLWVVGGYGFSFPGSEPLRGHGNVLVWDIAAEQAVTDEWITAGGGMYSNAEWILPNYPDQLFESGGGDVYNVKAPGIDYDPTTDSFVAWPNAGAPYVLDLKTKTWTTGGAEGAPAYAGNSGGTFGRWRYVEAYNVFILVNSVDEDVYFYKHTASCGPR